MTSPSFRVGLGVDSHAFEKAPSSRPLKIGGIIIPHDRGLLGDSDADVVLHALFNAIASAIGDRGLGFYFGKKEMENPLNKDSAHLLLTALGKMKEKGFHVGNLSVTIEGAQPRMEKHVPAMKENVARVLGITPEEVGITVTSGDGLTSFGKGEGLYAQVMVLLSR